MKAHIWQTIILHIITPPFIENRLWTSVYRESYFTIKCRRIREQYRTQRKLHSRWRWNFYSSWFRFSRQPSLALSLGTLYSGLHCRKSKCDRHVILSVLCPKPVRDDHNPPLQDFCAVQNDPVCPVSISEFSMRLSTSPTKLCWRWSIIKTVTTLINS